MAENKPIITKSQMINRIAELHEALVRKTQECEELNKKAVDLMKALSIANTNLQQKEKECEEWKNKYGKEYSTRRYFEDTAKSAQNDFLTARGENYHNHLNYQEELNELKKENARATAQYNKVVQQNKDLQTERLKYLNQRNITETELNQLKLLMEGKNTMYEQLKTENEELSRCHSELVSESKRLKSENEKLKQKLERIKEACIATKNIESVEDMYTAKLSGKYLKSREIMQIIEGAKNG